MVAFRLEGLNSTNKGELEASPLPPAFARCLISCTSVSGLTTVADRSLLVGR